MENPSLEKLNSKVVTWFGIDGENHTTLVPVLQKRSVLSMGIWILALVPPLKSLPLHSGASGLCPAQPFSLVDAPSRQ